MDGEARIGAFPDGESGDHGVVASPPGDNHVGSLLQGGDDGLVSHLSHEGGTVHDRLDAKVEPGLEVLDVAPLDCGAYHLAWNIRINPGQPKAQPAFARHFPNEFDCRIHVATRPRSARTANDQRDLGLASGTNQFGKLALDAEVGYQRFTGAKVMRPRVCRDRKSTRLNSSQ